MIQLSACMKSWVLLAGMATTGTALVFNNLPAQAQSPRTASAAPAQPAAGGAEKSAGEPPPEAPRTAPVAPEAPLPSRPTERIPVGVAVDFPTDI